jgi:hypothetical protein
MFVIAMKRIISIVLAFFLIFAIVAIQKLNTTVKASPDIYQGDLILTGNNVTIIEGSFDINGSIIVEENATLILRNAILNITHVGGGIFLQNPLNGNPRLRAEDTIIANAYDNRFYGNSSALFLNCSASGSYLLYHETNATIVDSTINSLQTRDFSIASIANSTIDYLEIVSFSANASIFNLFPEFFVFWDFQLNCSVQIDPLGQAPHVTLKQTTINKWGFSFQSTITASNPEIINSKIWSLHANGISHISAYNSTLNAIELYQSSVVLLVNSTHSTHYLSLFGDSKVYVSWCLGVHVIDSISQNVPSANVTARYPNATIAQSKLTGDSGWATLNLMEKMINSTGEYLIGNYNVEASYETYSNNTEVTMTGNQIVTLRLEGFVVPEFPSFLILPLFMIATLLAVIVYKRKHTVGQI